MDEDLELIDRTLEGEREAFDDLVRKYQKPLYAMLYRMVSSHEDASDLLQKTFVKAFTGLHGFERRSSFKTWLYQIAINLSKNVYRDRAKVEYVSIDDVVIRRDPHTLELMIRNENRQMLQRALGDLPEKQRITLLLRIQGDRKFEEIAMIMKCSLVTAKTNYHHAVNKLKLLLKDRIASEKTDEIQGAAKP